MDFFSHFIERLPLAVGPSWLDPDSLIRTFGMLGVLAIVFMESGLMVGFFLPGDSLLFTAGLLSANDVLPDIWVLLVTIPIAAIAGDQTGYWIGRRFGPPLFNRPDSRFFKREYVDQTAAFFEKHGPRAIILARFVPIVRAFVPVMAGTSQMHYRTFLTYDIIGGILWGAGVTTLGYFLGQIEFVKNNIEFILILVVALSVIPVVLEIRKAKREADSHQKPEPFENPIDEEGEPIHEPGQDAGLDSK
ncbi:MAG: VTT domain-containing protein [Solirubrobacterales bacterium]|nr:VTT domain-containing protein [Solirubrobacterales bacterium]MCB8915912.1 VTT domain-containing protein [Thermoleophilales bacterium]